MMIPPTTFNRRLVALESRSSLALSQSHDCPRRASERAEILGMLSQSRRRLALKALALSAKQLALPGLHSQGGGTQIGRGKEGPRDSLELCKLSRLPLKGSTKAGPDS